MAERFRQRRIGAEIQKVISARLLRGLKDPRFSLGMISVSAVDVTRDGSYAYCYLSIMPYGENDDDIAAQIKKNIIEAFEHSKGVFKQEIGKKIKLRHVPELIFRLDTSLEYGQKIDSIIDSFEYFNDELKTEDDDF